MPFLECATLALLASQTMQPIDRMQVVRRHNVTLTQPNPDRPLQVGNGNFAFGMDVTGLQTFAPLNNMSNWGWASSPLPPGVKVSDYHYQPRETHGRVVTYPLWDPKHPDISAWLAANPHRIDLGRIGLILFKRDGGRAEVTDISNIKQTLDLWTGTARSTFELQGSAVTVTTSCHPNLDEVGVTVESPLLAEKRLGVFLDCPGDTDEQFQTFVGDWGHPAVLAPVSETTGACTLKRELGADSYFTHLSWQNGVLKPPGFLSGGILTILEAKYGAEGHWLDVTDKAQKALKNGRLSMVAGNELAGDPALHVPKTLQVRYAFDGKELSQEAPEGRTLLIEPNPAARQYTLWGQGASLSFTYGFSKRQNLTMSSPKEIESASAKGWAHYWNSGAAIDFSQCKDPRASDLERRVILSQYVMKVQEAGNVPPQESGLVNNGWFGKFHMEMLWWHAAHWALWNRWPEFDAETSVYGRLLPEAQAIAKREGYKGARWPKALGDDFHEWPHEIHSLLVWQQPHPIFFAELDYDAHPTPATLKKWAPIVEATADFMASYAYLNPDTGHYDLGPPMQLASENVPSEDAHNPTYELGYWRFGLRTAREWRHRMGLPENESWKRVEDGLAPLPVQEGRYVLYEGVPDMWTKWNFEHPALTATYGILPGDGVDPAVMKATLAQLNQSWNFDRTWGWDYPMLAMCAARLGDPNQAMDYLFTSSAQFQFDERGLATGGPFPYFPSNGGLLYAVAMLAGGWHGSQGRAPGFPAQWDVRFEGFGIAP
jgi:hypothetical protein